jgi:hypothetical protein
MSSIRAWSRKRSVRWRPAASGRRRSIGCPDVEHAAIDDALDLERQLARNLQPALAA